MNYLELSVGPTQRVFHSIDRRLRAVPTISRNALLHLNARLDGTYVVLYQLSGEPREIRETLSRHKDVLDCEIVPIEDGNERKSITEDVQAFVHLAVSPSGDRIVDLADDHSLIIDPPITFEGDEMCVRLVGTDSGLRCVLQSMPDGVEFAVRDAGEYEPDSSDLLSPLTDRQLEVFKTAVEQGYYEVPRRVTHQDLAGTLGCAPSTVDEHLRKAESSVVTHLF